MINETTTWTTFKGEVSSFDKAEHQHLSNIYYFHTHVNNNKHLKELALIQYRPHPEFIEEIKYLYYKNMLKDDTDRTIIVYNGNEIGEILNFKIGVFEYFINR